MGWVKRAAGFLAVLLAAANAGQAKTLQITPLTLASGTVGVSYSQALSATGGTAPYTWSVTVGTLPVGLAISSGGTISGSPQNSGTSVFTVKAQDGAGDSGTQSLQITVISNPVITTATLPNATAGLAYSTTVASSGAVAPVSWTISLGSLPQGLSLAASTGVISGTPAAAGVASFTVKLTDSGGGSATKALSLTVNANPPVITTSSLPAGTVGVAYSQTLAASGGTPPYTWSLASGSLPAGLSLGAGGTISGTPGSAGLSNFTVRATDSGLVSASVSAPAALSVTINPAALKITTSSLATGTVGVGYSQGLSASGGTTPYVWSLASGSLPAGLSLGAGGTISGTPGSAGSSSFTVRVTDSASATTTAALSVTINPAALVITTSSLPAGTVGAAYSQGLSASGGTTPYVWTLASGSPPAGLSLGAGGTISGTPGSAGSSNFTVRVTDNASATTTAALSVTINPAALKITTSSLAAGTVGAAYSQGLSASGGTTPYVWSLASGSLPAGLSLGAGGTISGTPGGAGSSSFTVRVTDSASATTTAALTVTINPATLVITTSSVPAGTVGVAYSQGLSASGGTTPYVWSVASGSLPAGLSLGAGGTISGTPGSAGSSSFTVRVTDNASATTTAALSVTINPAALVITTSSLPAGTVGVAYSQGLSASGGTTPYVWSVASGSLPAGLSLGAGGTISGTPGSAGSSSFTVRVTDNASATTTAALSVTINPAALKITTSSLPAGTVGVAYSQGLSASGGTTPYVWTLASGSLPAGLSLGVGGTISGTPGSAGSSSFTVRVTDSASATTTAALSVTINPAALVITTSSLPAGTVGVAYSQGLGASGGIAPYVWSVSSGSLPAGLSLAAGGTISGTPGSAGSSNFTVRVTDNASATTTAALSVTINPAAL